MRSNDAAGELRALHAGERVLILPNVWDAASAALFAAAGAGALATTSAGLAWSCGYPDGDALPRASLLFALGAICRVSGKLPVSADVEGGFSQDPETVADLVRELCALGVGGINLEDGGADPDVLSAKIRAVKRSVAACGGDVFVNARTDVYLREMATGDAAVNEVVARARRYAAAGADGIFVPGLAAPAEIAAIASAVDLPLNLMAIPQLSPVRELYALGVRRLSAGDALAARAYGAARAAAEAFLAGGDAAVLFSEPAVDYASTNALLAGAAAAAPAPRP
ncbi:MAG TPA: isocitrate lyase/phosphoenolpyruvate mutase family protein [Candidatus Tumulicola sp.]|nr:isocitrate lyase/phosphoenolpyruvate mutase family protein [Candidatus Tumulicola sp.]